MLSFLLKVPLFLFCFKSGRRLLLSIATMLILLVLFHHLTPQKFTPSAVQERIGDELVGKAVEQFPWSKEVGSVMLISDRAAWSDYYVDAIRARVAAGDGRGGHKFDILPEGFTTRVLKTLGFNTTKSPLTDEEISAIVRGMDADTLLLVRFGGSDYIEDEKVAEARLSCTFYSKKGGAPRKIAVSTSQIKEGTGAVGTVFRFFRTMPPAKRLVWGVLGALLFPFLMAPFTLFLVHLQSAKVNGFMIFVYALILFVYEAFCLPTPSDLPRALLAIAVGISIVWYLLKTCDLLAAPGFQRRMELSPHRR